MSLPLPSNHLRLRHLRALTYSPSSHPPPPAPPLSHNLLPISDITITLRLTPTARAPAWIAFDGRNRTCLKPGDRLTVTLAQYPVPVIVKSTTTDDWIQVLVRDAPVVA